MLLKYGNTIKIICLVCASLALVYLGHWVADNHWQAKYSALEASYAKSAEKAATDALTKQQKLLQELDNAYKTQKHLQEKHDRNVSDSRIAADRLRIELDRIKALPTINNTSTIAERANAATDRLVLAELLGESDERAGAYGAEADKLRIALGQCNSEYEAVRLAVGGG